MAAANDRYLRPTRHTRTREKPEDMTATPHTDSCANSCVTVSKLTPDWVHFLFDILNNISIKYKFYVIVFYCVRLLVDVFNVRICTIRVILNLLDNFRHYCLISVSSFCRPVPKLAANARCIWYNSGRSQNWNPFCWFLHQLLMLVLLMCLISMLGSFRTGCDCDHLAS